MTALAANRPIKEILPVDVFNDPVYTGVKIYKGAIVGVDTSGYLRPMVKGTTLTVRGVADEYVDNTSGASGAVNCRSTSGVFEFQNDGTHPVVTGTEGQIVYGEDDQTVAANNTGSRNPVGRLHSFDTVNSKVRVSIGLADVVTGLAAANNLSDVGSASTSRANIGANVAVLTTERLPLDSAGVYYIPLPVACTVVDIRSAVEGVTTATGAATITSALDTTDITDGVITIAVGAVVGEKDSATPSALNVATEGQNLRLTVAPNSQDAAAFARVSVEITY